MAPRTAGEHGRAALARLAAGAGWSPLAAGVSALAAAVDELAGVDVTAEHIDDVSDATLALHHLRARVDALQLGVLASFDKREGYIRDGAATAASWLRRRTNSDFGPTTVLTKTARRLAELPELGGLLARGDVNLAHVVAVASACVPGRAEAVRAAEPILAELARSNPPRDVRRALRHLADAVDPDGSDPADELPADPDPLRELTLRASLNGRGQLDATLDPLTREALSVLLDAFDTPDPADTPPEQRRSAPQRRHDAFAALLHTLLAQPGLPSVQGARPQVLIALNLADLFDLPDDHPLAGVTLTDLAALAGIDLTDLGLGNPDEGGPDTSDRDAGESSTKDDGSGADDDKHRPAPDGTAQQPRQGDGETSTSDGETNPSDGEASDEASASDDTDAVQAEHDNRSPSGDTRASADRGADGAARSRPYGRRGAGGSGRSDGQAAPIPRVGRFGSGVPINPALMRSLLPAATVMAVLTLGPWRAVNVGSKHRTLPAWLRTVLTMMHRHCRGPDCDRPANWTEAHHVTDWVLARTTDLNDSLPLCAFHHRLITNRGWKARLDHRSGDVIWNSPDGRTITVPPPQP